MLFVRIRKLIWRLSGADLEVAQLTERLAREQALVTSLLARVPEPAAPAAPAAAPAAQVVQAVQDAIRAAGQRPLTAADIVRTQTHVVQVKDFNDVDITI